MPTAGERVIQTASKYLGVRENPDGSNRGEFIDGWERVWGLAGQPWCGMFAAAMFKEAGVDDAGLCHPSTAEMCRRARAANAVWDGHGTIPAGALWVSCGIHTCLVASDRGGGLVATVEGNHANAVGTGIRSVADGLIVIPPAVRADTPAPQPPSVTSYWIEDPDAQPKLFGPWRDKAARDHELATIPQARRQRARLVRGRGGSFGWIEGPRRLYGPWDDRDARDRALDALERRLGHNLRAFGRTVHGSV